MLKELNKLLMRHLENNDMEAALTVSNQILELKPPSPHHYYNHAMLCIDLGLMHEAATSFYGACNRMPECPIIRRMLSDVLLSIGEFREGLMHREWRFNFPLHDSPAPLAPMPIVMEIAPRIRACYRQPYWDGKTDLTDKAILVFNEAGHGDIIQNVRYLPKIKAKKVILDVKEEVYELLKGITDEVIVFKKEDRMTQFGRTFTNLGSFINLPPHDYVVSLHSLLYYFDPDLAEIPFTVPPLTPKPVESEAINLVRKCDKLKVGIAWAGSEKNEGDDHRSMFKREFAPLASPEIQLFSLQLGKMTRKWPGGKVNLLEGADLKDIDLAPWLHDFNVTANVIKELDAVVAVDTSVGHLAGALDVPVWTVLPDKKWTEWRWQKIWYGSQRVLIQETPGDWRTLLEKVKSEIRSIPVCVAR